jgi:hypothetical protein
MADPVPTETAAPAIEIADLHVYYGYAMPCRACR